MIYNFLAILGLIIAAILSIIFIVLVKTGIWRNAVTNIVSRRTAIALISLAIVRLESSLRGKTVVTESEGGTVRVWDAERGDCLGTFRMKDCRYILPSPDGKMILLTEGDSPALIWDVETRQTLATIQPHGLSAMSFIPYPYPGIGAACWFPDSERIMLEGGKSRIWICDARSGQLLVKLRTVGGELDARSVSGDGRSIITHTLLSGEAVWRRVRPERSSVARVPAFWFLLLACSVFSWSYGVDLSRHVARMRASGQGGWRALVDRCLRRAFIGCLIVIAIVIVLFAALLFVASTVKTAR